MNNIQPYEDPILRKMDPVKETENGNEYQCLPIK
jgi:hypothetical protein